MKSILSQLLFNTVPVPQARGRKVRFDVDEPDIHVATGPLDERISTLLTRHGYPMTAREIAAGIGSNASQVNKGLRILLKQDRVEVVTVPGSIKEYAIKID